MAETELQITEADFMSQIIDLAYLYGWLVQHARAAWSNKGYRTPIQGDSGFPDLVLVNPRQERVIFAEVKSERGKLTLAQVQWIEALKACGQEAYVWRPRDFHQITWLLWPQEYRKTRQEVTQ